MYPFIAEEPSVLDRESGLSRLTKLKMGSNFAGHLQALYSPLSSNLLPYTMVDMHYAGFQCCELLSLKGCVKGQGKWSQPAGHTKNRI